MTTLSLTASPAHLSDLIDLVAVHGGGKCEIRKEYADSEMFETKAYIATITVDERREAAIRRILSEACSTVTVL